MLRLYFEVKDLAALRFAISPATETVGALRLLADPERAGPHRPWLNALGEVTLDAPLSLVLELLQAHGYVPDFLTPPATAPIGDLETELAAIRATLDRPPRAQSALHPPNTLTERPRALR